MGPTLTGSPDTLRTKDDGEVWKLGDIINSTPVSVSKPPDYYHLIYGDESFQNYLDANKDRETVVYVGANDGMLHAFTSWKYNDGQYTQPASTSEAIGDELWAYIPQTLLPHLKFLADPEYGHTYYVDLKPKVFDAQINGVWKTLLLVGLNMGGKAIWAEGDFDGNSSTADTIRDFHPTYACIDVTEPRIPRLLWERSYENLAMSTSYPAIVAVGKSRSESGGTYTWSAGKWLAVFGSGPTDYDGSSSQSGHMFVVDLETGEPYRSLDTASVSHDWLFETGTNYTVMNSPVAFDKNLTYNVDSIYFGSTTKVRSVGYDTDGVTVIDNGLAGNVFKINTHSFSSGYGVPSDDPEADWTMTSLFDSPGPVAASVALSTDTNGNVWAFFGTGRYQTGSDKTDQTQQYFFGVKDPYFNYDHENGSAGDDYYLSGTNSLELGISDLFNANPYDVHTNRKVSDGTNVISWDNLVDAARNEDGWYRELEANPAMLRNGSFPRRRYSGALSFSPDIHPTTISAGLGATPNFMPPTMKPVRPTTNIFCQVSSRRPR
jgi:type IV pilus assembly protein PilY1